MKDTRFGFGLAAWGSGLQAYNGIVRKQRAFSMVELMVVMAIICIMLACLAPALSSALRKAHQTADTMGHRYPTHPEPSRTGTGYWERGGKGVAEPKPAPIGPTGGETGGDGGTSGGGSSGSTGTSTGPNRKSGVISAAISAS